jgi:hypothetical protein
MNLTISGGKRDLYSQQAEIEPATDETVQRGAGEESQ